MSKEGVKKRKEIKLTFSYITFFRFFLSIAFIDELLFFCFVFLRKKKKNKKINDSNTNNRNVYEHILLK